MDFEGDRGGRWSYDLQRPLGPRGGFGQVFEGTAEDGGEVAVKVIKLGAGGVARLRSRERDIADKLEGVDATFLIRVFDTSVVNDELLIVMERAQKNLANHMEQHSPISEGDAGTILHDVVAGLRELHQASVIHRDLKPGNVLWHENKWKLADFGIARDMELGTQTLTFLGAGTPPYMAPEIWAGQSPSFKSDLYALGCIAFELVSGQPPFLGPDEDDFRRQHTEDQPPDPATDNAILRRLVLRLLSKDPASRYQDARAVEEALVRAQSRPASGRLADLAAQHAEERARLDAQTASANVESKRVDDLVRQSVADLEECLKDAVEVIKDEIPEAVHEWIGNSPKLMTDDATLVFHPRRVEPPPPDTALAFSEVTATNRRGVQATIANIVYEQVAGSRYLWMLYRFKAMGALREYPYGPMDREHGLPDNDFWSERQHMRSNVTHIFTVRKDALTPEGVAELFGTALELNPA